VAKAEGIPVWVVYREDRDVFTLRWNDPRTGRRKQKSCEAKNRKDAYKAAGALADELAKNGGSLAGESKERPTWDAFCTRYRENYLVHTSATNRAKWSKVASEVDVEFAERRIKMPMLADITAEFLECVESRMHALGNAASTVKSKMDTLQSGLNWAVSLNLLDPLNTRRERGRVEQVESEMRGRPLTGEELDRLLLQPKAITKIAGQAVGWEHLIRGLYLSGLRISEALGLHESRRDCHRPIGLNSSRPAIAFLSSQKNRRDQVVAITPDFAEFLRATKPIDGWYFNPSGPKGRYRTAGSVSHLISEMGAKAKIVVEAGKTPEDARFATAHDLRRTFAQRWASRVMPPILQHLMRHASFDTTKKFYVGSSADAATNAIHEGWKRSAGASADVLLCDQVCDQLNSASAKNRK
jgi:integrase